MANKKADSTGFLEHTQITVTTGSVDDPKIQEILDQVAKEKLEALSFETIRVVTNGSFADTDVYYGDKKLPVDEVHYSITENGGQLILSMSPAAKVTIVHDPSIPSK